MNRRLSPFEKQAVQLAFQAMLDKGYFSISTVQETAEMFGCKVQHGSRDYNALRLLHCVNYSQMPKEVKDELPHRVIAVLCESGIDYDDLAELFLPVGIGSKIAGWFRDAVARARRSA